MTEHDTFWLLPENQRFALIGMAKQLTRKLEIEYGEAFDLLRQCGYFVVQTDRKRKKLEEAGFLQYLE